MASRAFDPADLPAKAYTVNYLKPEITVLNPAVKKDVELLTNKLGDGFVITNRTLDDSMWTLATDDAQAPGVAYLYERKTGAITRLFDQRPALVKAPLVPMQSLELAARDGLTLVSYLSLPPGSDSNGDGRPDKPVPLVLNVHGGPWGRDNYGFDSEAQWFANRGYASLAVNYRGSGDPRTEEGRKLLAERSPISRVAAIKKPLLIAQGANDPRVNQAESQQIVDGMKAKGLPVTYVLYPEEGHGFARPTNRISFYAIAEGFLSECLGGRYQPIGDDFKGANLQVLEGKTHVPGLADALK